MASLLIFKTVNKSVISSWRYKIVLDLWISRKMSDIRSSISPFRQHPSMTSALLPLGSSFISLLLCSTQTKDRLLQHRLPLPLWHFTAFSGRNRTEAYSDVRNPLTPTHFNNLYILWFLIQSYKNKFMVIPQMHIHCCCQRHVRAARHV